MVLEVAPHRAPNRPLISLELWMSACSPFLQGGNCLDRASRQLARDLVEEDVYFFDEIFGLGLNLARCALHRLCSFNRLLGVFCHFAKHRDHFVRTLSYSGDAF